MLLGQAVPSWLCASNSRSICMLAVKGRMAVSIHLNVAAEDPEDLLVTWDRTSQQNMCNHTRRSSW